MTIFTNKAFTLSALGLIAGVSATSMQGCGEELCGPCGTLANGSLSISGDAKLDGFFKAVADLGDAHATINAEFEGHILALAEIYGVAAAEVDAAFVAQVQAAIQADFDLYLDGGIQVKYEGPKCSANVNVAVEAQASCEASADCEVMADPGMVSVSCEGKCEGSCSAECMGQVSCKTPTVGIQCSGECEGSCELEAAASCEGTCRGQCNGTCSATNAMGECAGACDGDCQGTCELSGRAQCGGTCHGTCFADADPGGCEGELGCSGTCMGECGGKCEGSATPPSASADCEASAECNAQASAQAEANIECTPPSLEIDFAFQGGVSAEAQAAFVARIKELKVRGIAIIQGFARYKALIDGEIDGEVVFNPAPIARIQAEFEAVADLAIAGDLNIVAGKIPCIAPAIVEVGETFGSIAAEAGASIQAQVGFVAFLTTGG
jgi:hypothetical protein